MNNFFKKLFGVDKIEERIAEATRKKIELEEEIKHREKAAEAAKEAERLAKLSPKELATEKKEPWIAVLNTHVNQENVRNGFFELDWNEFFIVELRKAGYTGASEEELVDKWFQDLCRNVGNEASVNMENRGSGFVNRALREDGRSEVS